MPSSISSSEMAAQAMVDGSAERFDRPGFRQTASDRPGVAQPVPERHIPDRPWSMIWVIALLLFAVLMTGWEMYWRNYGAEPAYANSSGSWSAQRRRIDEGEGNKLVLIGSSRVLFDTQLHVWEKLTGERPIQLALEGTSSVPVLEDLADDPKFTGRLMIGVAPELFFSGFAMRGQLIGDFHRQGPGQRVGQWLSQKFVEPYFAYYDPDFALGTVLERQDWPLREGMHAFKHVRKLSVSDADRDTHMWAKVENDAEYRNLARSIWTQFMNFPPPPNMNTPEKLKAVIDKQIQRCKIAIDKMRARGVRVVFVRMPSAEDYHSFELKVFPRTNTWDPLLQVTGAAGIHFEDYPQLQGYQLPEWSHLSASEAVRFTAQLAPLVEKAMAEQGAPAPAKP